jgi:hypothetical protein
VPRSPLGAFLFADALHLWDVNAERVRALKLARLRDVEGYHETMEGCYLRSRVVLKFPEGNESVHLNRKEDAQEMLRFLGALIGFRNSNDESTRVLMSNSPALLGALARRLATTGSLGDLAGLDVGAAPPRPSRTPAPKTSSSFASLVRAALPWPAALGVAGLALVACPWLDHFLLDEHYYAAAAAETTARHDAVDRYLSRFPEGRHVQQVRDLRDDLRFDKAVREADQLQSPEPVHKYLADSSNVRHRDEAPERIQALHAAIFAKVKAGDPERPDLIDKYLERFPQGPHVQEARDLRDDRRFALAVRKAERESDAAPLREYLADKDNTRHRDEVPRRIDEVDDSSWARAKASAADRWDVLDKYLSRFPQGRHAQEARDLRDDRRFAFAVSRSREKRGPSPLRDYLSDKSNTRHRSEAREQVAAAYDAAIRALKQRAMLTEANMDADVFGAFVALLEALKDVDRPVVTVGFKATQDPEPRTREQIYLEKQIYAFKLKDVPELARIEKQSAKKTAILPLGGVFDEEQTALREGVILERLRQAVEKVLGPDILSLEAAPPGQAPLLEVGYHTFASGRLYTYTSTQKTYDEYRLVRETTEVKGLLRGYDVSWTITVRTPGKERVYQCKLGSEPATNLHYDSEVYDPDWAPYAIILYSAFFDMSSRLIQNFAIKPEPPPASYRFREVTGRKN